MEIPAAATISQLKSTTTGDIRWVWQGYMAAGSITLFTSRWKAGKTTLLSILLSRLHEGGTLAGTTVTPCPAIVVTEESSSIWVARSNKLSFGPNVKWICQPFLTQPTNDEWSDLLRSIVPLIEEQSALVVFDPLVSVFPGGDENTAASIIRFLAPLRGLTQRGVAVALLHHPRKGQVLDPRGSGALSAAADILMELDCTPNAAPDDRRRWLRSRSRHDVTPSERLIELNAAGTDYLVRDPVAEDCANGIEVIRWILSDAEDKVTRESIAENWPEIHEKPHRTTLGRWLQQAVDQSVIRRDGQGRRRNRYRYWLAEREQHFLPDLPPLFDFTMRRVRKSDRAE